MASEIADKLSAFARDNIIDLRVPKDRRIFVVVKCGFFREAINYAVKDLGFSHLSTITGIDAGDNIEVLYHLACKNAVALSLGTMVSKADAHLPTITDLLPSAVLYEREVHDLLGVRFDGNSNLAPLLLPDGWPQDVHPLIKECTFGELQQIKLEKGG